VDVDASGEVVPLFILDGGSQETQVDYAMTRTARDSAVRMARRLIQLQPSRDAIPATIRRIDCSIPMDVIPFIGCL
jgi:hypothetical protein